MQPATIHFVDAYCELLNEQFNQAHDPEVVLAATNAIFHHAIGRWNFRTRHQAWAAASDFNQALLLGARGTEFLLREHVLTTAVGRVNGDLLVVTANPGHALDTTVQGEAWWEGANPPNNGEVLLRGNVQWNIEFGREFFSLFPAGIVGGWTHQWWRKVMRVARRFVEPLWDGVDAPEVRWPWASAQGGIGCMDLIPFHSPRDGLTPHAIRAGQSAAQVLLRTVANTSLDLAVRAKPRAMLIASAIGKHLVDQRGWEHVADMPFQNYVVSMYRTNDIAIFVLGVQLFAGAVHGISNAHFDDLAAAMRNLMEVHG